MNLSKIGIIVSEENGFRNVDVYNKTHLD